MGQRKKPYIPKAFESTGISNDTSANIYGSMLDSPAFKDLTKNQRLLYIYMKKQYYGTRKPGRDFPDVEQLQGADLFYFNLALAVKYGLYSRSNDRQFYNDIAAIEQHGFIKTVSNGGLQSLDLFINLLENGNFGMIVVESLPGKFPVGYKKASWNFP